MKSPLIDIKKNINKYGYNLYLINNGLIPQYAYTIGFYEKVQFEIILVGSYYSFDDIKNIFNICSENLNELGKIDTLDCGELGTFKIKTTSEEWSNKLILGAFDYYKINDIKLIQIIPTNDSLTKDVPDMSEKWNPHNSPPWKWLNENWEYNIDRNIQVVTNIDTLQGNFVTELMRWEEKEWELFAGPGPDVSKKDIRIVPFGTLLALDKTLEDALFIPIGKGLWRENELSKWNSWG